MLEALRLFATGDYTPDMRAVLGEEDSLVVDLILSIREAVVS